MKKHALRVFAIAAMFLCSGYASCSVGTYGPPRGYYQGPPPAYYAPPPPVYYAPPPPPVYYVPARPKYYPPHRWCC